MEPSYIGEHTLIGQVGNALIVCAFAFALLTVVSYFLAEKNKQDAGWLKIGRTAYWLHSISIWAMFLCLFIMLMNGYYEYKYVWDHRNNEMPLRYIFSAMWEGQEGSLILWTFWHAVLGVLLMYQSKKWEAPVMVVFGLVQVFITSTLFGIYIFDYKVGGSPFLLLRELPENLGLPWTTFKDYLVRFPQFNDGTGMNPLLQNYWMTIHPPTIFLGFASTIVPFAFAIAGLWRNELRSWIKPALPWTFFAMMILGTGVLMGGAWAYEALSFGGFWAWDPVENASLVPWLTLVGGAHVMMINRKKNNSLFTAFLLIFFTFILVWYSTFLTRSGVLGDSSVHSFTGSGLLNQLLLSLLFFIALPTALLIREKKVRMIYVYASIVFIAIVVFFDQEQIGIILFGLLTLAGLIYANNKYFSKPVNEDKIWSREFWMLIGSLILLISALQISMQTSLPLVNYFSESIFKPILSAFGEVKNPFLLKLVSGTMAPPAQENAFEAYHRWQIPLAIFLTIFISVGQFLRYKDTPLKQLFKKLRLPFIIALGLTILTVVSFPFKAGQDFLIILLLFSATFLVVANLYYWINTLKGKLGQAGASIAHVGFGLILIGALISTSQKSFISPGNRTVEALSKDFKRTKDVLLYKNDTTALNNYFACYNRKFKEGVNLFYEVDYFESVEKDFRKGDVVYFMESLFSAKHDHKAKFGSFESFQENWDPIETPDSLMVENAKLWIPIVPGKKLFTLYPAIQLNPQFGNVPEPDTKHYFNKDLYSHIRYADLEEHPSDSLGYFAPKEFHIHLGDTINSRSALLILDSVLAVYDVENYGLTQKDMAIKAKLKVLAPDLSEHLAEPLFVAIDSAYLSTIPDTLDYPDIRISFDNIDPREGSFTFSLTENELSNPDFIVMQAISFPWINILWAGCILMFIGTFIAVRKRFSDLKK